MQFTSQQILLSLLLFIESRTCDKIIVISAFFRKVKLMSIVIRKVDVSGDGGKFGKWHYIDRIMWLIYTSFHNNKGVVKEVLKEGVGVDTPPKKSKVTGTKKNEKCTRSFLCCLIPNQIC